MKSLRNGKTLHKISVPLVVRPTGNDQAILIKRFGQKIEAMFMNGSSLLCSLSGLLQNIMM